MTGLAFKQMNEAVRGEGLCPRPHSLEQRPGLATPSSLRPLSTRVGQEAALRPLSNPAAGEGLSAEGKRRAGQSGDHQDGLGKTGWGSGSLGKNGPGGQLLDAQLPPRRQLCLYSASPSPPPLLCCFLIQVSGLGFPQGFSPHPSLLPL